MTDHIHKFLTFKILLNYAEEEYFALQYCTVNECSVHRILKLQWEDLE